MTFLVLLPLDFVWGEVPALNHAGQEVVAEGTSRHSP
jgi:hypothetical protein